MKMKMLDIKATMSKLRTSYPKRVRDRLRTFNDQTRRAMRGI